MAKEIEILWKLDSSVDEVVSTLSKESTFETRHIVDTYYYDPLRKQLQFNGDQLTHCLRIRESENKKQLTYKEDHFDSEGVWLYSDEEEVSLDDTHRMRDILINLGFKSLIKIDNTKHVFLIEDYEIVVEDIKGLGGFIEIELKQNSEQLDVGLEREKIRKFLDSRKINVEEELSMGKPELMLRKLKN